MKHSLRSRSGAITITAIFAMVALLALGSSYLYITVQNTKSAANLGYGINAEYAAQAGYEYAYAIINNKKIWPQTGQDLPIDLNNNDTGTFNLTIIDQQTKNAITAGSAVTAGNYLVTSTGKFRGAIHTFTGVISINSAPTPPSNGPDAVWKAPTTPEFANTKKYAALTKLDVTAWSDNRVNNSKYGDNYKLATTKSNYDNVSWKLYVNYADPKNVYLKLLDANFFQVKNYSNLQKNKVPTNFWDASLFSAGRFEVDGDLSFNSSPLTLLDSSQQAFYYVHGNVNINTRLNGNFVIIADGDINLNNGPSTGFIQLYAKQNINLYSSVTGYGIFMCLGNMHVTQGTYNKAFMFADGGGGNNGDFHGIKLDGAKITGAVYSNKDLVIDGGTVIEYDPSAIPN